MKTLTLALAALFAAAFSTQADESAINPQVRKIVDEVSETRIKGIIEHLASFKTRHLLSPADMPNYGIGAARQWIFDEMKSYSPRLQVRFDKWRVKKNGQRIFKDVDVYNVVAVLPGKTMPETQIIVSGHYDTINLGRPQGGAANAAGPGGADAPAAIGERPAQANYEASAELPAPGACDDASGVSAVMELARIMSQYEFDKTLVFIAFAGEEEGLVGSTLEAEKMKAEKVDLEAVLNNDIIGTDVSGNGRSDSSSVAIYSDDRPDSPAQGLARYIKLIGERYMPSMRVNVNFQEDRLGRGGDHTPFRQEGFAAVRFSTPNEIYANQHHETDTLENMSVPYTARVAKVNAAVMASLGLSPKAPAVMRMPGAGRGDGNGRGRGAGGGTAGQAETTADAGRGGRAGQNPQQAPAAARGPLPMITRGSGYDAVLQWRPAGNEAAIKGYSIVMRPTTSALWEQEIYVGKVNTYTLKDVSVDDVRFGVKAVGNDGTESIVSPYVYPERTKATYDATPIQ
jgi:Peptidase family M28